MHSPRTSMLLLPIEKVYDTPMDGKDKQARMGTFYHPIRLGRLDGSAFETVEALVDTGATWTWIPRPILDWLAAHLIGLGHIS